MSSILKIWRQGRWCKQGVTVTLLWHSRVSRAPPDHTLPTFLNLYGMQKWYNYIFRKSWSSGITGWSGKNDCITLCYHDRGVALEKFQSNFYNFHINLILILIKNKAKKCTNEISFALPIMMTLLISKSVGDLFNVGIYDMHIEARWKFFLKFI